jgi:hypothetical protein
MFLFGRIYRYFSHSINDVPLIRLQASPKVNARLDYHIAPPGSLVRQKYIPVVVGQAGELDLASLDVERKELNIYLAEAL